MIPLKNILKFFPFIFVFIIPTTLLGQDDDEAFYENLLNIEVEVENPVYKPVLSLGTGMLHYLGDVKNPGNNPLSGEFGYKFNLSTYAGKKNFYKLNFFLMYGHLQGQDFSISRAMQSDPDNLPTEEFNFQTRTIYQNSSFRSEFFQLGANLEYGFAHWLGLTRKFRPYFSAGVSAMYFSPKGDIYLGSDQNPAYQFYHFWSDGTVRNFAENSSESWRAVAIPFDKDYETDLPSLAGRDPNGIGRYSTTTASFPLEVGFDMYLSYRIYLRVSTTYFYTLSDLLDNYNQQVAERYNTAHDGLNDRYLFTNISMHFDLFSDPKYMRVEQEFAELDFDESFYEIYFADQDMDGIYDRTDNCPDTPVGIGAEVDSLGCPYDMDGDGIPDIIDNEPNTPQGLIVDDTGTQISPEKLAEMFEHGEAVKREEIQVIPVMPIWTRSIAFAPGEIPSRFKSVDLDADGYISFPELLKTIDDFFDQKSNFALDDIYDLNNFFFSQ